MHESTSNFLVSPFLLTTTNTRRKSSGSLSYSWAVSDAPCLCKSSEDKGLSLMLVSLGSWVKLEEKCQMGRGSILKISS